MSRPSAQLRLGAFFNPTGHHVASWRHPGAQADAGINFKHYVEIAQTAERDVASMWARRMQTLSARNTRSNLAPSAVWASWT